MAVLTYNHLACCYRRVGHAKSSLKILEVAKRLLYEKKLTKYKAMTYLNLSAILSFLGRHEKALDVTKLSVHFFQEEINNMENCSKYEKDEESFKVEFKEKTKMLSIAYYNKSVEEETLLYYEEA